MVLVFLAALVLFCLNRRAIKQLREEIQLLKQQLDGERPIPRPKLAECVEEGAPFYTAEPPEPVMYETSAPIQAVPSEDLAKVLEEESPKACKAFGIEQEFGGKLFVWMGAIALALAGFYMVKYSIEAGLLSPAVRVILGSVFGVALLAAGSWSWGRAGFANASRISQALSGAGVADLYACAFAATDVYHFIPSSVGFAAMAAVTVVAVLVSLRQGPPIAVLGLLGGFLTPALVGEASSSAGPLFIYLYAVVAGLMVVIRKRSWWFLATPTIAFAFIWVLVWAFTNNMLGDNPTWLGMFLIATSLTVCYANRRQAEAEGASKALEYLALGGSVLLMGIVAARSGFEVSDWMLFGLLSAASLGLAAFDEVRFGFAPRVSAGVAAAMLLLWNSATPVEFGTVLGLFGGAYVLSGCVFQFRSQKPAAWAGLVAAVALGYYLIGFSELRRETASLPYFWGLVALALCAFKTVVLQQVRAYVDDAHPEKQKLLGIFAVAATAFLSIGLTIELKNNFLMVALAGEALALSLIGTKIRIDALRSITRALFYAFWLLLLPQVAFLVILVLNSLAGDELRGQAQSLVIQEPLVRLGLPALFFAMSSHLWRRKRDDRFVYSLELLAAGLLGWMGYYLLRDAFHAEPNAVLFHAGFIERGVITNAIFAYALASLVAGRKLNRASLSSFGVGLINVALFRTIYFDLALHNPIWSLQAVGEVPVFNALLVNYGLPILWVWLARREMIGLDRRLHADNLARLSFVLAFTLVSLQVRHSFHGAILQEGATSIAEIYSYSVAWLLFGIGVLMLGTVCRERSMRVASLGVLLLTVGKVFLYDASELTGLWRVFSFFGLGLSLLALSWFYSRFVFRGEPTERA